MGERSKPSASPVHPRERGEQIQVTGSKSYLRGSSPRTRGTVLRLRDGARALRFIPANAGNSRALSKSSRSNPVHPRERGEQRSWYQSSRSQTGSSPRTRGTVLLFSNQSSRSRFIPANAGNRHISVKYACGNTVHPRERGEQVNAPQSCAATGGSSPRTRGTVVQEAGVIPLCRFIPANAGNR